jgi:hypothetical protein
MRVVIGRFEKPPRRAVFFVLGNTVDSLQIKPLNLGVVINTNPMPNFENFSASNAAQEQGEQFLENSIDSYLEAVDEAIPRVHEAQNVSELYEVVKPFFHENMGVWKEDGSDLPSLAKEDGLDSKQLTIRSWLTSVVSNPFNRSDDGRVLDANKLFTTAVRHKMHEMEPQIRADAYQSATEYKEKKGF